MDDLLMRKNFDSVFKDKGGYFDHNLETGDAGIYLKSAIDDFYHHINLVPKSDGYEWPIFYVRFITNPKVGALVRKKGDIYYIGIYLGTIFILSTLFCRMLSQKSILSDFGDASKESGGKIFNNQIWNYEKMLDLNGSDSFSSPIDETRQDLVGVLLQYAMRFLFLHEYAHIRYGHIDYVKSIDGGEISELNYEDGKSNNLPPFISQTLEMDADAWATYMGLQHILEFNDNKRLLREQYRVFYETKESSIRLWIFAIYTLFRIFGMEVPSIEKLKTTSHPYPGVRQHMILSTILNAALKKERFKLDPNSTRDLILRTVKEAEDAFKEISEGPTDAKAFLFAYHEESREHAKFIIQYWNNVRPLLEPFTHADLAKLEER